MYVRQTQRQEITGEMLSTIFTKVLEKIPNHIAGIERQIQIGKAVEELTPHERNFLHKKYNEFLFEMRRLNASDIEMGGVTAKESIWFRVQGSKNPRQDLGRWTLDQSDILCHSLITRKQRERLFNNRASDFSYSMRDGDTMTRYRASLYFDLGHMALNMRAIAAKVYSFKSLGFHENITKSFSLIHEKQGLVLVTGITGSGKSTTMDSIVDANNQIVDAHIVIIGDPIEFIHQSKKCIIRHREVGRDVLSFKEGAIQALRQDPDIIVVGEMRDPDTIMTCLEISDTGHKVFSTLHTGCAVETIDRIVAECPPIEQERVRMRLADQLRVVVSQKLIPDRQNKLVMAKEVLLVTTPVKAAIRNRNTQEIYQMISEGGKLGMITLEQDLVRLYRQGRISMESAVDFANNKKRIKELLS